MFLNLYNLCKIEYITAKQFSKKGEIDYSIDALLLISMSDKYCRESSLSLEEPQADIEKMEITVRPISKMSKGGYVSNIATRQINNLNIFDLTLDHGKGTALFFDWDIKIPSEIRNCGIGKYATSKLIKWGKEHGDSYRVRPRDLSSVDAHDKNTRDHRNHFYQSLGFTLDFKKDPIEKKNGHVFAENMSQLKEEWNDKKVEIKSPENIIYQLQYDLSQKNREFELLKKSNRQYSDKYYDVSLRYKRLKHCLWGCGACLTLATLFYMIIVK